MDIGGIPNKILGGVEKHATLLAFAGAAYLRKAEGNTPSGQALSALVGHFTNLGIPSPAQISAGGGGGAYGALGEAIITLSNPRLLGEKLFNANHAYSVLVKVGLAAWIAGELGVIPSKYGDVGKKVAIGAGAAAIVMPGSSGGGSGSNSSNSGYGY